MSLLVRPWHLVIYMFSKFQGKNSCIVNGFRAMCLTIFLFEAGSVVKDGRTVFMSVDEDFSERLFQQSYSITYEGVGPEFPGVSIVSTSPQLPNISNGGFLLYYIHLTYHRSSTISPQSFKTSWVIISHNTAFRRTALQLAHPAQLLKRRRATTE